MSQILQKLQRINFTITKYQRFNKVHEAACQCVRDAKTGSGAGDKIAQNATRMLISGQSEKQFKKCHDDNGVPYPQDKMIKVKQTIYEVVAKVMAHHKIAKEVKNTLHVARAALKDIEDQFKGAFCAKCSKGGDQSSVISDQEINAMRKALGDTNDKETK